jgi:diguanylate cyclase (GGDEF)-like protein
MGDSETKTGIQGAAALNTAFERFIPVGAVEGWALLLNEAIRSAREEPGNGLLVLMDRMTAQRPDADALRAVADRAVIFGDSDAASADNVVTVSKVPAELSGAQFLVLVSSRMAVAFATRAERKSEGAYGAWTLSRGDVVHFAESLLTEAGVSDVGMPTADGADPDALSATANHLMAVYAELLDTSRTAAAVNKDDLFSVLDILKAISAKRRAHDILFVFVEQIAKVINVDRCSVVRVWGGDRKGHVLASHEDERVHDLVISLDKYPELRIVMERREKIVITDVGRDALTREFSSELSAAGIQSLAVVPIMLFDTNVGSLFLRVARKHGGFTPREVSFCEIVAEAASNALERAHLFEQIQRTNERLEFLAVTDGLTGLYNHRYFRKRLQEEFDRAVRYGLSLSCLIFDVDNFKKINDTFGHLQGDSILREMSVRIMRTVRKSDIVARYGGEEFTVILTQTSIEGGRAEAERLHRELSTKPYPGMPDNMQVTVSIGVCALDHERMLDSDALLRVADSALYEAKRRGKNQVVEGTAEGEHK